MVKFLLMSKNATTKDGRKFKKFFTSVNIIVKGEEDKGLQAKTLTVKFESNIDTKNFRRGIITVNKDTDVEMPYKYEIREVVDKDGNKKIRYPHVYVKAVDNYEERLPKSTGSFDLKDEEETQDVSIED